MNKKLLGCGALILAGVAGCIPSLNPAYKEEFNGDFKLARESVAEQSAGAK